MKEIAVDNDFDVDELTQKISAVMSRWSVQMLDINAPDWVIYDHDMGIRYHIHFNVDFNDIETRIRLEDLKLNVIHHIESLKDETTYRDNLVNAVFLKD